MILARPEYKMCESIIRKYVFITGPEIRRQKGRGAKRRNIYATIKKPEERANVEEQKKRTLRRA
jgi:hypothetical protein